jgi:hypothetical protein
MNATNVAFTNFNGDTRDGNSMCTDAVIGSQVRDRFNSVAAPTIYTRELTPGCECRFGARHLVVVKRDFA